MAAFSLVLMVAFIQQQLVTSQQQEVYLIRPDDYKFHEIPVTPKGTPVFAVLVDLAIWAITEVSLEKHHVEVDLILSVEWIDNRLSVNPNVSSSRNWVTIGKEIDYVWSPTLTLRNCKGCSPINFKSISRIPVYIHKKQGRFWAELRTLQKFGCSIELHYFPMDVQHCTVEIYTGEDDVEAIILKHYMGDGERKIYSNVTLSEFAPPSIRTGYCTYPMSGTAGYSCLELQIRFERLLGYHMTTCYLPTMFIVLISWISFWLPADVIPARVALGLTSLLTLATRLDQAQRNLPAVSYAKAIDVWMLGCIFIVSMSLFEFAVCNYMLRKGIGSCVPENKPFFVKRHNTSASKIHSFIEKRTEDSPLPEEDSVFRGRPQDATMCDRISRIFFPVCFFIFNLIYWNYYLH